MRGLTLGAVSIAVANGLAVREYRGRLHAHASVRTRPDDSVVSIRIVTEMASAGVDLWSTIRAPWRLVTSSAIT